MAEVYKETEMGCVSELDYLGLRFETKLLTKKRFRRVMHEDIVRLVPRIIVKKFFDCSQF